MTREEAIKVLEMFLHKQCDLKRTEFAYDANTVWSAVYMASKALEQEPIDDVLDKIGAEIKSMDFDFGDFYDHTDRIIEMVCEVIDKYRKKLG